MKYRKLPEFRERTAEETRQILIIHNAKEKIKQIHKNIDDSKIELANFSPKEDKVTNGRLELFRKIGLKIMLLKP